MKKLDLIDGEFSIRAVLEDAQIEKELACRFVKRFTKCTSIGINFGADLNVSGSLS